MQNIICYLIPMFISWIVVVVAYILKRKDKITLTQQGAISFGILILQVIAQSIILLK